MRVFTFLLSMFDCMVFTGCAAMILHSVPREKETSWIRKAVGWAVFVTLSTVLPLFGNNLLTVVVLMAWYLFMGRRWYYRNRTGIFCQLIFILLLMATQLSAAFLSVVWMSRMNLERPVYLMVLVFLRCFLLTAMSAVLRRTIRKRFYPAGRGKLRNSGMIMVPVISMALVFLYGISGEFFFLRYGYQWFLVFCVLLFVINFYCLYFWYDVSRNGELKHRLELMQQQNELTLQYYRELEENYSRSRKIIHDIRNHLHYLEKSRQAQEGYMEDVHAMLNSLGMKFYTENRMLNIVLNDKLSMMRGKVECNLGGVGLSFVSDMDITTIFANLLDNAAEAQQGVEEPWTKIRGEYIRDFSVIRISNSCSGRYVEGRSSKEGHEGLGIPNVRQALEKYQGELRISGNEKEFSAVVIFPRQENGKERGGES